MAIKGHATCDFQHQEPAVVRKQTISFQLKTMKTFRLKKLLTQLKKKRRIRMFFTKLVLYVQLCKKYTDHAFKENSIVVTLLLRYFYYANFLHVIFFLKKSNYKCKHNHFGNSGEDSFDIFAKEHQQCLWKTIWKTMHEKT